VPCTKVAFRASLSFSSAHSLLLRPLRGRFCFLFFFPNEPARSCPPLFVQKFPPITLTFPRTLPRLYLIQSYPPRVTGTRGRFGGYSPLPFGVRPVTRSALPDNRVTMLFFGGRTDPFRLIFSQFFWPSAKRPSYGRCALGSAVKTELCEWELWAIDGTFGTSSQEGQRTAFCCSSLGLEGPLPFLLLLIVCFS